MLRWMMGVTRIEEIRTEEIGVSKSNTFVANISEKIR